MYVAVNNKCRLSVVSELPEKDISNVMVWCWQYSTISYQLWLVSELPVKDVSNLVVQCVDICIYYSILQ